MEKIQGSAVTPLDFMRNKGKKFHVIYLDGGKQRDHLLTMSLLARNLLADNGILIWDDYDWGADQPPEDRPHDAIDLLLDAIDLLLELHASEMDIL